MPRKLKVPVNSAPCENCDTSVLLDARGLPVSLYWQTGVGRNNIKYVFCSAACSLACYEKARIDK